MTEHNSNPAIDVCVCTFQRASLFETLKSLAQQTFGCDRFRVIVADNDAEPVKREEVEAFARTCGLNLNYVHAPLRNISIARNACLDHATAPWVAFIDDDEVADPSWLTGLHDRVLETGADVVFGPVNAVYGPEAPSWMSRARMHDIRPTFLPDDRVENGYTSNVLLNRERLAGLRFLPELGRTGGEDTVFFVELVRRGAVMVFAEAALVTERVPPGRLQLNWMLSRSYRAGQTHARTLLSEAGGRGLLRRTGAIAVTVLKYLYCLAFTAIQLGNPAQWRKSLVRASLHAGVISRLLGRSEIELY